MKKRYLFAAVIFCLCFAMAFASCGNDGEPKETEAIIESDTAPDTVPDTEPGESETEPAETETEAPEVSDDLREPVENEKAIEFIEFQYKKATEIIDWVENRSLPADLNIELADGAGNIYFPIIDEVSRPELEGESISSFASLKKYINSVFARSIADDLILLAEENYADFEGKLCLVAAYIDTEPSIDTEESTEDTEEIPEETEEPEETDMPEELFVPEIISTEFFLSKFTDKLFRYTAKVTYSTPESEETEKTEEDESLPTEDAEEDEVLPPENVKYFDFIFENTGSGWFWTAFPEIS